MTPEMLQMMNEKSLERHSAKTVDAGGLGLMGDFRELFTAIDSLVEQELDDGKEKVIALIRLQEARMWVNTGIANKHGYIEIADEPTQG